VVRGSVQKAVTGREESGGVSCQVSIEHKAHPVRRPPWR
jgi:hypothetical protein